jgi:hypothetical protein
MTNNSNSDHAPQPTPFGGLEPILQAHSLLFTQRGWLVDEYGIFDEQAQQVGGVRHGPSGLMKRRMLIVDPKGIVLLELERPVEAFGWSLVVSMPGRVELAKFVYRRGFRLRMDIACRGVVHGRVRAAGDVGGNYVVVDRDEVEVARIIRAREGVSSYGSTLRVHGPLVDPLRTAALVAPVAVEVRLREQAHGNALTA